MNSDFGHPAGTVVVGGGMLGLALAERLAQSGEPVTLIEAAQQLGGLAAPWRLGEIAWDRYYHVTLLSDAATRALLRRLDLEREVVWQRTRTGAFVNECLHPASGAREFLRLPGLSAWAKARIALTMAAAPRVPLEVLDRQTAEMWLRRWSGNEGYERFWEPLLRSKLGDAHARAAASFIAATITRLSAARRAGLGEERFGYVSGGYAVTIERYERRLRELGVALRTGVVVHSVHRVVSGGFEIATPSGVEYARRVVVTAPAPIAARLCADLTDAERHRLNGLSYQGVACAALLLSRPLSPYYVTNLLDGGFPFTGVIEMTALVDPRQFGGRSLVYLPKYAAADDAIFDEEEDAVRRRFLAGLRRIHPDLRDEEILAFGLARARHVFAMPTVGYRDLVPPVRCATEGLFIVNGAQITGGTLNVNETLALAERASKEITSV